MSGRGGYLILLVVFDREKYTSAFQDGHDYLNWRGTFADGLLALTSQGKNSAGDQREK
jgi:hypothetical protein